MPQNTIHKRNSRKVRTAFPKRGIRKEAGCTTVKRQEKEAARIISDSVLALRLPPVPGAVIVTKLGGKEYGDDDYHQMYKDLFAIYKRYCKITGCEFSEFDPLAAGLDLGKSIFIILERIKSILPQGYLMTVEFLDEYFLNLQKEVDFDQYWHFFNIQPVVEYLAKRNTSLHDLFISTLSCLVHGCDFMTWDSGPLYAVDIIDDDWQIVDYVDSRFEDEKEKEKMLYELRAQAESYKSGEPHRYARLIRNSFLKPEEILGRLASMNLRNPIKKWIIQALDLVKDGLRIRDFVYDGNFDDLGYDEPAVKLEQQVTIIWSDKDFVFDITCEYMDIEVGNFGAEPAILNYHFGKRTKNFSLESLKKSEGWMQKIDDLFISYGEVLKYIKHE